MIFGSHTENFFMNGFSINWILSQSIKEHAQNTAHTQPIEISGISCESYTLTFWHTSCHKKRRMASQFAWIRRIPNVVDATVLINELYFIFIVLKNINAHTPTSTAKNVFESVTKKYQMFWCSFKDSHAQQTTEREHSTILPAVSIPHNFVLEKICFGYIRI